MYRRAGIAALAAVALWFTTEALAQTVPSPPAVEAFGTLPEVSQPSLTPDGKHLATVQVYQGRPVAVIRSLEPGAPAPVGLPYKDGTIVGVQWANNERLLVTIQMNTKVHGDTGTKPWYRTISVDAAGQNGVVLFSNKADLTQYNYSASSIVGSSVEDPNHVYIPLFAPEYENSTHLLFRNTLYRVDVKTGEAERVMAGYADTTDWFVDDHGNVVGRIDQSKHPITDHLFVQNKGNWAEIETGTIDHPLAVAGMSPDGAGMVLYGIDPTTGTYGLIVRDLAQDKKTALFFDPNFDVTYTLLDPWSQRVVGVAVTDDRPIDKYFDPKLQAMQNALQASFPGKTVHAVTWDKALEKVIFRAEGPRSPATYYLLDRTTHRATALAVTYMALREADLGDMKAYPYKARDGLDIPAYLTLPPGKTPTKLPVVVMPHGGPMARDDLGFDWMAQFLANRGYAVLQPNFRGSSGYGTKYEKAGYGEWGLKMQDDVTDGVKKLIADGIADPKRICIVGWSYGGYAALAGAAFTPDLYACAAGGGGVYDLDEFLATRAQDFGRDSAMIASWTHFIGDRWHDSAKLRASSPTENAEKIKCPILLVHGTDDATVRINQSQDMEKALRSAGKKVKLVTIPGETHYLQSSNSRMVWLTELEKFLEENIGH